MTAYILKLLLLVPLVGGMAFAALWMWRKVQPGMALGQRERLVKLVDAVPLGATGRLAVVDFADKRLLVAVTRAGGVQLLSESMAPGAAGDA
ncbi:flagellar biogenesis protein FliO [Sphingomonas deserti]|uniref:Flagellar biogenesis protein FliO n=2 Tax=Allosphingosinicella deserti TaxID=2116704 RepID=A0A2P7QPV0_9SPHN|nr:flagellar biogenesis protein FliO [Sphingomonas deserti]